MAGCLIPWTLSLTTILIIYQVPATRTSQVLSHPLGLQAMLELCVLLCPLFRAFSLYSFLEDSKAAHSCQDCHWPQFSLDSSHETISGKPVLYFALPK